MKQIIKYLLLIYKKIGPAGYHCRYYPTCSNYAGEAIDKYGVTKGLFLALKRLIRCNQLFPAGYDPVP